MEKMNSNLVVLLLYRRWMRFNHWSWFSVFCGCVLFLFAAIEGALNHISVYAILGLSVVFLVIAGFLSRRSNDAYELFSSLKEEGCLDFITFNSHYFEMNYARRDRIPLEKEYQAFKKIRNHLEKIYLEKIIKREMK